MAGFYDAAFLALPEEVLSTTLVHHQHYFPVVSDRGELKEAFLAVVNTQPKDERLIAKNAERVVAARLRDARFFWESDRKSPLASRHERLHTVAFHKKLGSYRDKTERIEQLAGWIAGEVLGKPEAAGAAATAARLAKADLTTDMVFEFPELQGRMGGIYAREEGQPEPVWKAIYTSTCRSAWKRMRRRPRSGTRRGGRDVGGAFSGRQARYGDSVCCMRGSEPPAHGIRSDCGGRRTGASGS